MKTWILPTVLIVIDLLAATVYACNVDWRRGGVLGGRRCFDCDSDVLSAPGGDIKAGGMA